jgi:hypothetical protein
MSGGARIRLRPGRAQSDRDGWRDSPAVFSVAAPVLALGSVGLSYWADATWPGHFSPSLAAYLFDLALYGQVLVAPLVLLGLRWAAVITASGQVLSVAVLIAATGPYQTVLAVPVGASMAGLSLAEIAALLASPGPRRGLALLKARHWACLAAAAVPAALLMPPLPYSRIYRFLVQSGDLGSLALIPAAAAAAPLLVFVAMWLRSAAGKRLVVLFAPLPYPHLLDKAVAAFALSFRLELVGVMASVPVALIGVIAVAVVRSGRTCAASGRPPGDSVPRPAASSLAAPGRLSWGSGPRAEVDLAVRTHFTHARRAAAAAGALAALGLGGASAAAAPAAPAIGAPAARAPGPAPVPSRPGCASRARKTRALLTPSGPAVSRAGRPDRPPSAPQPQWRCRLRP